MLYVNITSITFLVSFCEFSITYDFSTLMAYTLFFSLMNERVISYLLSVSETGYCWETQRGDV